MGRALAGIDRGSFSLVGAVGHDFYEGKRDGPRGFPRFTDADLRTPAQYAGYLRMATERSLERLSQDSFDLLLLHNPDRTGYESEAVWDGMAALRDAGLTRLIGVAPGPANGFTLDVIRCIERFGEVIDWAMLILNPLEPWPGELPLEAAARHDVKVITRVVDYGGLLWGDLGPQTPVGEHDHRRFRPKGWIEAGLEKLARMQPIAERAGLTPIQLACAWNLSHPAVACCAPTLIQEAGRQRPPRRGQAGRACGPTGDRAVAGGPRLDPRDRRQHRLDAAEGRQPRARRAGGARPLAAQRRARGCRRPLEPRSAADPDVRGLTPGPTPRVHKASLTRVRRSVNPSLGGF